jgi:hypothetical protein
MGSGAMNALFWIAAVLVMYNLNKEMNRNIFKDDIT